MNIPAILLIFVAASTFAAETSTNHTALKPAVPTIIAPVIPTLEKEIARLEVIVAANKKRLHDLQTLRSQVREGGGDVRKADKMVTDFMVASGSAAQRLAQLKAQRLAIKIQTGK